MKRSKDTTVRLDPDVANAIIEARKQLVEEGVLEMIGRNAEGKPIYALAKPPFGGQQVH